MSDELLDTPTAVPTDPPKKPSVLAKVKSKVNKKSILCVVLLVAAIGAGQEDQLLANLTHILLASFGIT